MQRSSSKLLRFLPLARAVFVPVLILLVLGAAALRLTAQTVSDDFNSDGALSPGATPPPGWTSFLLPNVPPGVPTYIFGFGPFTLDDPGYYGQGAYYFPTNPASAGNYAFRITTPVITNDPVPLEFSRAGAFRTDATYTGRFFAQVDLVNWNNAWDEEIAGLAFYANVDNPINPSTYAIGWGPGLATLGIAILHVTGDFPDLTATYGIIGEATAEGGATLNTNRQYRFIASSHDGTTFLVQLFDTLQPNSPWQSAITTDSNLAGGYTGMLVASAQTPGPDSTQGGDATFDNFYTTLPGAGAMPATVTDLTPQPAGKATSHQLQVGIFNRDTSVNTGTIGLYLDGQPITSGVTISNYVYKPYNAGLAGPNGESYPTSFPGATVSYTIANTFAVGSLHTNAVVFQDNLSTWYTNIWSWTVGWPVPFAPSGSLSVRGFDARLVMSYNTTDATYANIAQGATVPLNLPNSVATAQAVLNYRYPVNFAATNIVQSVNFDRYVEVVPGNGNAAIQFPGMCLPAPDPAFVNSYAVEVLAYLQLPAGTNSFWVDSDDAMAVYSGTNLTDTSVVLMTKDSVAHQQFDWVVINAGLYPIHVVFQEGGGGSYLGLSTLNLAAGTTNLVNGASSVQAFYPLACMSSTTVKGPFTLDAAANASNSLTTSSAAATCNSGTGPVNNLTVTGGTMTVPIPSTPKYFRLDGPRKTKITSVTKSGSNLLINYQAY